MGSEAGVHRAFALRYTTDRARLLYWWAALRLQGTGGERGGCRGAYTCGLVHACLLRVK